MRTSEAVVAAGPETLFRGFRVVGRKGETSMGWSEQNGMRGQDWEAA